MERIVSTGILEQSEIAVIRNAQPPLLCDPEPEAFPRASISVVTYWDGTAHRQRQSVICERELSVIANGNRLVNLLCSNVALRELAYGFLYSEGAISRLDDVRACSIDENAMTAVFDLAVPVHPSPCPIVTSGFGGKALHSPEPASPNAHAAYARRNPFSVTDVTKAVGLMRSFAREYTVTRGIHCSALFADGVPLASFEDIGRHNTFDKLAGRCLIDGRDVSGALLTTTGRISEEMVRKALRLGVSGIASLSGPTDRAVRAARKAGVLLAGYVRESSAIVYSGMD